MASAKQPEYTLKEVAAHATEDDAWMVIHGQVYDVTKYLHDHPGGASILVEAAGTDASEAFDNAGHSEDASEIMAAYSVGKAKGVARKTAPRQVRIAARPDSKEATPERTRIGPKAAAATVAVVGVVAIGQVVRALSRLDDASALSTVSRPLLAGLSTLSASPAERRGGPGFLGGFAVASAIFAIAGGLAMRKLSSLIHFESGFMRNPPHLKLPTVANSDPLLQRGWLDATTYHPLPLVKKDLIAPGVYRLTFALPTETTVLGLPIGQHVAIRAVIDGQVVSRSYTPTSNNSDLGVLELVVRCYPDGLLTGKYLANLQVGDEVEFRGPKGAMRYRRGICRRIGMIAGGTGITPMYQLIRAICEDPWDTTEVSLVYASRSEPDILLRRELETFARRYPKNFKLHYLLDKPPEKWAYGSGHVSADVISERLPAPAPDTKVMLCGPPGMVNAAKNMLAGLGYEQPGAISRMSDQVFCF